MVLKDEEDMEEGVSQEEATNVIEGVAEVSLNFVVGLITPKTMKLRGQIGSQAVVVLIDFGATHNFISTELAKKLELPLAKTEGYGVIMGTGLSVKGGAQGSVAFLT